MAAVRPRSSRPLFACLFWQVGLKEAKVQRFDAEELPRLLADANCEMLRLWRRFVLAPS